jgi:hypothetical protein
MIANAQARVWQPIPATVSALSDAAFIPIVPASMVKTRSNTKYYFFVLYLL